MRPINRAQPVGPPSAYKTYQVSSPLQTHYREATCAEVDCAAWRSGFRTVVDEGTGLGMQQAAYIRSTCVAEGVAASEAVRLAGTRRYTEAREGALTAFTFPPGTRCFARHQVELGRPELYVVRDGDWRGNPRGTPARQHKQAADWVEDFAEHQDRIKTLVERG